MKWGYHKIAWAYVMSMSIYCCKWCDKCMSHRTISVTRLTLPLSFLLLSLLYCCYWFQCFNIYIYILVLFHRSPFLCCCCFFRIVLYLHSLWQKCRRSSNSHLTRDYQWQESNTPCQRCVCSIYCSIVQHWIQSNHFFFIQQTPAVLLLD